MFGQMGITQLAGGEGDIALDVNKKKNGWLPRPFNIAGPAKSGICGLETGTDTLCADIALYVRLHGTSSAVLQICELGWRPVRPRLSRAMTERPASLFGRDSNPAAIHSNRCFHLTRMCLAHHGGQEVRPPRWPHLRQSLHFKLQILRQEFANDDRSAQKARG